MTVIAFKDGVMAADTMLSDGNAQNRVQKLFRLPDGGVAGGCGQWNRAYAGLKFLADGGDPEAKDGTPPSVKDALLLIARPDGSLWLVEDEFPPYPLLDKEAAIGCGADAALMAMTLGLSAIEAVAKVTKQDVFCGDPVQSMEVQETHEYPGVVTHSKRSTGVKSAPKRKTRKAR